MQLQNATQQVKKKEIPPLLTKDYSTKYTAQYTAKQNPHQTNAKEKEKEKRKELITSLGITSTIRSIRNLLK